MYIVMTQQIKSKYNKFNHNFYMLWDFIKSIFVKVKKNPIENTTPISIMSFNLRRDTPEDNMNCWQYRKDAVADFRSKISYCWYARSYATYV